MWTQISGRMPASSQASSELSTASLTVVSRALRGLSNPSRWRFLAKNSLTEMSRWLGRHRLGGGAALVSLGACRAHRVRLRLVVVGDEQSLFHGRTKLGARVRRFGGILRGRPGSFLVAVAARPCRGEMSSRLALGLSRALHPRDCIRSDTGFPPSGRRGSGVTATFFGAQPRRGDERLRCASRAPPPRPSARLRS